MTAIELLNQVLELFKQFKKGSKILKSLLTQKIIQASFEHRYILNLVDFEFTVIETVVKNDKLVECYLNALDGTPYKAEIVFDDKWYLKSFLLQCQGCFGDDKHCSVCGGSGWGVL